MWNNNNPGYPGNNNAPYPPPGGFGAAPSFPSPGGFGTPMSQDTPPPFHLGYTPSYTPPSGPPQNAYPNPGGFPSQYPPPNSNNPSAFPNFPPPNPGYQPPSGPAPGQYPSPAGPPPSQYQPPPGPPGQNQWNPPSGPPPMPSRDSYPGQQGQHGPGPFNQNHGGYPGSNVNRPPPGPHPSQGPPIPGNHPINPPSNAQPHMPSFERQYTGPQGHQFAYQYSQCNGKKKALCIGINYRGQQAELKGCINDALNVKRFLCTTYGYKEEDIVMLTDDAKNPRQIPTTRNIMEAMRCISKRSDHFGTFYMLFANLSLFVVLFYFAAFLGLFEKLIFLLKSCNKITLNYTGRHKRDVLNGVILSVGQSSQGRPLNINLPSSKPSSSRVNLRTPREIAVLLGC